MKNTSEVSPEIMDQLWTEMMEGSQTALYKLLFKVFKTELWPVAASRIQSEDKARVEQVLYDFYFHLSVLSREQRTRYFDKLSTYESRLSYLRRSLKNFKVDGLREEQKEQKWTTSIEDEEGNTREIPAPNDYYNGVDAKVKQEMRYHAMVEGLETMTDLKPRDRYILLTYLMSNYYKGWGGRLHVAEELAKQLNMTEGAVKMSYSRNMERLRNQTKKIFEKTVMKAEESVL